MRLNATGWRVSNPLKTMVSLAVLASVGFLRARLAGAEDRSADLPRTAPSDSLKPPQLPAVDSVRVIQVRLWGAETSRDTLPSSGRDPLPRADSVRAGMDQRIVLVVRDLKSLVGRARCLDANERRVADCAPKRIELFLDGREIKGLIPESGAPRPGDRYGTLQFHLQRNAESDEVWADLLGAPPVESQRFWYRPTEVSVGLEGGYALPTDVVGASFALIRIHPAWFFIALIGLSIIALFFVRYALQSDVLRELGPKPVDGLKPYSLGRCQMAWWFLLVVGSFVFIFLITRSYNTINDTSLALIGISAGTFLGSAVIDAGGITATGNDLQRLRTQSDALGAELAELGARIAAAPGGGDGAVLTQTRAAKQAQLASVTEQLKAVQKAAQPRVSQGILQDLLSDAQGQSFHRFQIVVWTLVLTVLFVVSVWRRLSMPDFTPTMLGLLGISAGTYLGFKFPEQKN